MKRLLLFSIFISFFIFQSCTNSTSPTSPKIVVDGTSDSGGGNGIENKVYEAYVVSPEKLAAFQAFISPQLSQMLTLIPGGGKRELIHKWLLYKTWYIAPIELNTLSKETIGISFSKDKTDQLAIQTKKSVWIDSRKFEQMNIQEQAQLIIHEMVMSLYYLKFKSWRQICQEKLLLNDQCNEKDIIILNELFPGFEPKPFDSEDYENIRTVAGFFAVPRPIKSIKEIDDILINNGFDRRFTPTGLVDSSTKTEEQIVYHSSIEFPISTLTNLLDTSHFLNKYPNFCKSLCLSAESNCLMNSQKSTILFNNFKIPSTLFSIQSTNGSQFKEFNLQMNIDPNRTIHGSSVEFVSMKKRVYYFPELIPAIYPTPIIQGTEFRSGVVVALQDLSVESAPMTLLGFITSVGVMTSNTACTYAKPSASSMDNDTLLIYSEHLSAEDYGILRFRALFFPAFTMCGNK